MKDIRVLLADDDLIYCRFVTEILVNEGFLVQPANSVDQAMAALAGNQFHIMLLDMMFPALQDGFRLLDEVHENYPEIIILMVSGSGHIPEAVTAIKNGAYDFIQKPVSPDQIRLRMRNLAAYIESQMKVAAFAKTAIGMIGASSAMQLVFDNILRASRYDSPVLITGETGVGKELAAHAIHRLSSHGSKSMVCINCASVPKELFESELFGYEQGAFTGAVKNRKGYFEYANDNSLFLDEVTELPSSVQAKLLRVISEGEIQKLGGKIQKVNTRIIAASNRNLSTLLETGELREDLYYRLNAIQIVIPPLRERKDDVPALARFFCTDFCNRNNISPKEISFQAMNWLCEQEWRGNARELRSVIERGVIFAKNDHLTVADLLGSDQKSYNPDNKDDTSLHTVVRQFEKSYIEYSLRAHNGNVTHTASALGIDKSNLFKKISHYQISVKDQ